MQSPPRVCQHCLQHAALLCQDNNCSHHRALLSICRHSTGMLHCPQQTGIAPRMLEVSQLHDVSLTCVVDLRPGGEILAQLTVPAAQEQPKVTPCSSSTGRTTQGLPANGSRA